MSYQVIARRYRPQRFEEVIGQNHVSETLAHAIKKKRVGHAFLFCGPRGVGKTSTARILAKALNCINGPTPTPCNECPNCISITDGSSIDVIEIDAASNRGVDDVRQLREYVQLVPTGGSKYRIYIIDEVHMLTTEAFNALLKTLEEPPAHAIFVLATTAKNKVPATIISRCQPFDFKYITMTDIVNQLTLILENEKGIKISTSEKESILSTIARAAQGSMRDAESLLEQLISFTGGELNLEKTNALLGTLPFELIARLIDSIITENHKEALEHMSKLIEQGIEFEQLCNELLDYFRSLAIIQVVGKESEILDLTPEEKERRTKQAEQLKIGQVLRMMKLSTHSIEEIRKTVPGRVVMDMLVMDCIQTKQTPPLPELIQELRILQKEINTTGGTKKVEMISVPRMSGGSDLYTMPVVEEKEITEMESTIPDSGTISDIPTNSVSGTKISIEEIQKNWFEIQNEIRQEKPTLSSILSDITPSRLEQNTLVLTLDKSHKFHKSMLDKPDNRAAIESVLEKYYGIPLHIRIEISGTPQIQKTASIPIIKPVNRVEKNSDRDPLVQKIIEIFGVTRIDTHIRPHARGSENESEENLKEEST